MSRHIITWALAAHLLVCWTSVALRIDRFPLTWAPMYSVYKAPTGSKFRPLHRDRSWLKKHGWDATLRDGTQEQINQRDLNLPTRNMWRLYYQRTRGTPAPKYKHMNYDAGTIDRWLYGLAPGEAYYDIDWRQRLLVSVNKTLSRNPEADDFIVRLEARGERYLFDRKGLTFRGTAPRNATASWDETQTVDF